MSRGTPSGDAYLDLQNEARRMGRATQELHQLYVLEGFLARLAASPLRESFVLKGGVLLAAFGSRRATKDIDLAALDLSNDVDLVLHLLRDILAVSPELDDGIDFLPDTASAVAIREDDAYPGVRVKVEARLASASLPFHIDVNVGDPIWPEPLTVQVPRLRGGMPIVVKGYPLHMIHAEKIVTVIQRGTANTRWRDFGDIWSLSGRHQIQGDDLAGAIGEVATYRDAHIRPIAEVLNGFADIAQRRWAQWLARSSSTHLPADFAPVMDDVIVFASPVLDGDAAGLTWDPEVRRWV